MRSLQDPLKWFFLPIESFRLSLKSQNWKLWISLSETIAYICITEGSNPGGEEIRVLSSGLIPKISDSSLTFGTIHEWGTLTYNAIRSCIIKWYQTDFGLPVVPEENIM